MPGAEGAKAACEGYGYLKGGEVARARDSHGAAHLKGASNEPERGAAMTSGPQRSPTVCYGALDPPVGGTFHFENLIMPPLPKTCPKMVPSHKGGSLCVKDVLQKNFLVPGEIPLATRSHRFFGSTLVKATHLMRPSAQRKVPATSAGIAAVSVSLHRQRAWAKADLHRPTSPHAG